MQGNLDGLCGVYAIINAIKLSLGDRARLPSFESWLDLFYTLVVAADEHVGAVTATACGIDAKPLMQLLRAAARHMFDEHELKMSVQRVVKRRERPAFKKLLERLESLTAEPHSAIVMSFSGHLDHWTVLKNVAATSLVLFDSSKRTRVQIANCRMSYEPLLGGRRQHVIHPRAIFHVRMEQA